MQSFRDRRVLFAGDAAHGVSPFGARGANSGVQDADNLAWKLHLVASSQAPPALLDTYASEREFAADENIRNSTRATDFITPKSQASRIFRDATLQLARDCPFARRLVNSGRLSTPATLAASPLNTPDMDAFEGAMQPGAPCTDAPVRLHGEHQWLLQLLGPGFTLLHFGEFTQQLAATPVPVRTLIVAPGQLTEDGALSRRFDARPGTTYLIRPDQHVCARWRAFDPACIMSALSRATAC